MAKQWQGMDLQGGGLQTVQLQYKARQRKLPRAYAAWLLFVLGAPIPLESVSAAANELTRAPELSLFTSLQYAVDLGKNFEGLFELAYRYQDEVFFLETNQERDTFKGGSANRLDLRFAVQPVRDAWDAALYVNNLNDDRTITQVTALGSYPNAAISPPRQYGVEFTYRWQ